jgi:hypothetical protein
MRLQGKKQLFVIFKLAIVSETYYNRHNIL